MIIRNNMNDTKTKCPFCGEVERFYLIKGIDDLFRIHCYCCDFSTPARKYKKVAERDLDDVRCGRKAGRLSRKLDRVFE